MKRQKTRFAIIIISFLLLPITLFYFSPAIPFMATKINVLSGSVILLLTLLLLGILIGRFPCAWIMPCGGLQEICININNKRVKSRIARFIKFGIWIIWLSLLIIFTVKSGGYRKVDFFFATKNGISISNIYIFGIYYSVLALILIVSLTLGKRAMCHYFCWISPFMVVGKKIGNLLRLPAIKLNIDPDKCIDCKICDKNCPMSLNVNEMVKTGNIKNSECILCFNCVDACNNKAIRIGFGITK